MVTSAVTNLPEGYSVEQPSQQQTASSLPAGYTLEQPSAQSGVDISDTGGTITVPKDGESFADTVKRATDRAKQNPAQLQADIAKETTAKNLATKTAESLGGAAIAGTVGPALLAAPGEVVGALKAIPGATEAVLQHLEEHAASYAKAYPNLISLAGKLGIPTGIGALLVYLAKQSK